MLDPCSSKHYQDQSDNKNTKPNSNKPYTRKSAIIEKFQTQSNISTSSINNQVVTYDETKKRTYDKINTTQDFNSDKKQKTDNQSNLLDVSSSNKEVESKDPLQELIKKFKNDIKKIQETTEVQKKIIVEMTCTLEVEEKIVKENENIINKNLEEITSLKLEKDYFENLILHYKDLFSKKV